MSLLEQKSYSSYDRLSRYSVFPYFYHTLDNKYVRGITAHLDDTTVYVTHKVARNETLDSIALDSYNNPTLYWVIADFNRIQDPFEPLVEGTYLKIPSLSSIEYTIPYG